MQYSLILKSSVATITELNLSTLFAFIYTHHIIGFPQIFTKGLPGNLVDAYLAGIIPIMFINLISSFFCFMLIPIILLINISFDYKPMGKQTIIEQSKNYQIIQKSVLQCPFRDFLFRKAVWHIITPFLFSNITKLTKLHWF